MSNYIKTFSVLDHSDNETEPLISHNSTCISNDSEIIFPMGKSFICPSIKSRTLGPFRYNFSSLWKSCLSRLSAILKNAADAEALSR